MEGAGNLDNQNGKMALVPEIDLTYEPGLISVIIPTFDRSEMVREALTSVTAQTWQNTEIIIVDDGSSDGTFKFLQEWQSKNPQVALTIIKQANSGVSTARNVGLSRARGEFLYMLDSDDLIFPEALKTLVQLISASDSPYAVANIHCADAKGQILHGQNEGRSILSKQHFYSNRWMIHAALYRRSALAGSGLFNESLYVGEDTEFQWRVLATNGAGIKTSQYIGVRRQHSFGHLSHNREDIQCLQHALQARLALIDWLKRKGMEVPKINMRQSVAIFGTIFRFGNVRDWKSKDDAMSLFPLTAGKPASKLAFFRVIGKPYWRNYYKLLLGIYLGVRGVRDVFRLIGNLRFAVYRLELGQPFLLRMGVVRQTRHF